MTAKIDRPNHLTWSVILGVDECGQVRHYRRTSLTVPKNPLVEVFGYSVDDSSPEAVRHRTHKLCPFGNSSGDRCTKSSKTDPLGVCTVLHKDGPAITCPVRFRQDKVMIEDAARFFFPPKTNWVSLNKVKIRDRNGKSKGSIDTVLAAIDAKGRVTDFGALEMQAVCVSGNVRGPFVGYMEAPLVHADMDWPSRRYPKPDYLSTSRKRLASQLMFKGGIFYKWGKKMAVAVHTPFFQQLPELIEVEADKAGIAWLTYDLRQDATNHRYKLESTRMFYTDFENTARAITDAEPGDIKSFVETLEVRIEKGEIWIN